MPKTTLIVSLALLGFGCSLVLDPSDYGGGLDSDVPRDAQADARVPDTGPPADAGPPRDSGPPVDAGLPADSGPPVDAGSDTCETGFTCAPAAPSGWNGPFVVVSGPGTAAAPPCPSNAPATEFVARSGMNAPAATCGCGCDEPAGSQLNCGTSTLRTASNCIVIGTTHVVVATGSCQSISSLPSSGVWQATSSAFSATGGCDPDPTETVPPVSWAMAHRTCGFGAADTCAGGLCAPTPASGQRVCVFVAGETSCPAGYPNLIEMAEDATDDRACSACTCGDIEGSCSGELGLASSCGSLPTAYASIPVGGCVSASSHPTPHRLYGSFSPSGSCTPSSVSSTGAATPTTPRTVCCR